MTAHLADIDAVRASSRELVRELGFMQATLAATPHSASAVHALLEIGAHEGMTSAQLVQVLGLDKSSVSRMLAKLVAAQEVREAAARDDGRVKRLRLTAKGRKTVERIHAFGQAQVSNAFQRLNPSQQQAVAQGLSAYAGALRAHRLDSAEQAPSAIQVVTGYQPGFIGRVVEIHAAFYSAHAGFGQFFESQVATGIAEFAGRLHEPCNQVWAAMLNGRIVGALAIDGQALGGHAAHLRWFILDEGCRGSGVGRQLMAQAMAFCDAQGFAETRLWTFQGLDAARRLYESFGFGLVREEEGSQWGSAVTEQEFVRALRAV